MKSSDPNPSCEVLVVGAGPTGLVMAYELGRRGVRVRIVDRGAGPADQSRALAIQVRSLEIFDFMGIAPAFLKDAQRISHINVFMEARPLFRAAFDGLDSPYPFPIMLPQSETERILMQALAGRGIQVERRVELTGLTQDPEGVTARLQHEGGREETLRVPWVIGCDGAHSKVRRELNLPFRGAPYPEVFILADVRADWALQYNELYMFLKREGILGIFPMTEQWVRLISMRPPRDQDAEREPTLAEFQSLVDRYVPEGGRIFDPLWLASFRLHSRGVSEYRVGRVFVAGDAAHIHSPAGGQGMNTGIQDSFNLAWKLAWVIKKSSDPQILESYHAERFPIGQRVLRTTDRMFSMVVSVNPFIRFFRNYIFPPLARRILPRVTRWLTYFVSQLQVNYRNSRWVSEQPGGKILNQGPKAGERAPDGELLDAVTGTRMRLFEIFRSTEHVLLVFDGAQGGFDSNALEQLRIEYSGLFSICLIMPDKDEITLLPKPWSSYLDPTGNTRRAYGAETPCLYLIRPDRYVGFRQALGDLASFRRYLARHFPSQGPVA